MVTADPVGRELPAGVVVLTDRRLAAPSRRAGSRRHSSLPPDQRALVRVVAAAVDGGARWALLRERDLPAAERRALADVLRALLPPGRLIVAGPDPLGGTATHLAGADSAPSGPRPGWLVGRSCHDSGELGRLSIEDYVTLSPIFPTVTKPGYGPALGAPAAARLAAEVPGRAGAVPWLALGGVDSARRAAACADAGAAGVAVLGAVMRAGDPERVTRELAAAFGEPGPRVAGSAAARPGRRDPPRRWPPGRAGSRRGWGGGMTPPVVLTIAGSDSGGGAGIQADLKTFAALGAYGASVLTAITAQNTLGVTAIHPVPAEMVAAQLDAVLDDLPVAAVKVGMIGDPAVAAVLVRRLARLPNLVVDPVLVATSGSRLSGVAGVRPLLPYARVLTPNRHEAGALLGRRVETAEDMAEAAGALLEPRAKTAGPGAVVVTGSELAVDVLCHDGVVSVLRGAAVSTANNHGSGCTFSAAIAVRLAAGDDVPAAVRHAKRYVTGALRGGQSWRIGAGPGPLDHFGWSA